MACAFGLKSDATNHQQRAPLRAGAPSLRPPLALRQPNSTTSDHRTPLSLPVSLFTTLRFLSLVILLDS